MAHVLKGSQFYLHTPFSSANGMNHPCLCLPSRHWYLFTNPWGMEGWVGLGWLVGYIPKQTVLDFVTFLQRKAELTVDDWSKDIDTQQVAVKNTTLGCAQQPDWWWFSLNSIERVIS